MSNDPYKGSPLATPQQSEPRPPGPTAEALREGYQQCEGCGAVIPEARMEKTEEGWLCKWMCWLKFRKPAPALDREAHAKHIRALIADLNEAVATAHANEMFVLVQIDEPSLVDNTPSRIIAVIGGVL